MKVVNLQALCASCLPFIIFSVLISCGNCAPMGDYVSPDKFPKYPFQQYIQVRKSITVEHVPRSYYAHHDAGETQASSPVSADIASSASHQVSEGDEQDPHAASSFGRITHDVMTHKNQEVYEEKGYLDSAYDHQSHHSPDSGDSGSEHVEQAGSKDHAVHQALHSDSSSSKILDYAARVLYDQDAHQKGIYRARSGVTCPEVTDFKLKGTVRGRQPGGRRVTGLAAHIDCKRLKYFGSEPLPRAIFLDPAQSRHSLIPQQSMDQFLSDAKRNLF